MLVWCNGIRIRNRSLSNATKTRTRTATRVDYRLIERRFWSQRDDIRARMYIRTSYIAVDLVETLSIFRSLCHLTRFQPLSRSFLRRYIIDQPVISSPWLNFELWSLADRRSASISSVTFMTIARLWQTTRSSLNNWPSPLIFRNWVSLWFDFHVAQHWAFSNVWFVWNECQNQYRLIWYNIVTVTLITGIYIYSM